MALAPGSHLGSYEVASLLGVGGMGEVYRARDTKLNRDVALKILPDALASEPDRLARFRREAQLLASLNHHNIAIITGQHVHDWRGTTPILKQILESTGRFEVRINEEFRGAGPETLANYDLVVVNYNNRGDKDRWGDPANSALEGFVRSGKGLVLYHLALGAFNGWTEYEKMSGGNWRPNNGHHSARHDFTVDIKDADHPITRGLKSFPMKTDELYANLRWQPEGSYHVLATAYDDHALYQGKARQPIPGAGIHQPMLWTTQYGMGKVFVTTLGHGPTEVAQLAFGTTFARGAEWAATGKVTLPIPPELAR